jgi:hypothetical protein
MTLDSVGPSYLLPIKTKENAGSNPWNDRSCERIHERAFENELSSSDIKKMSGRVFSFMNSGAHRASLSG